MTLDRALTARECEFSLSYYNERSSQLSPNYIGRNSNSIDCANIFVKIAYRMSNEEWHDSFSMFI